MSYLIRACIRPQYHEEEEEEKEEIRILDDYLPTTKEYMAEEMRDLADALELFARDLRTISKDIKPAPFQKVVKGLKRQTTRAVYLLSEFDILNEVNRIYGQRAVYEERKGK